MVISIAGRPPNESTSKVSQLWEIFAKILRVMASEVDLFIISYHVILSFANDLMNTPIGPPHLLLCFLLKSHLFDILTGLIDKAKYESFYVPMYAPPDQELRVIIQEEGSFLAKDILVHDLTIFVDSSHINASWVANQIRPRLSR
jgi:hypothetical protein